MIILSGILLAFFQLMIESDKKWIWKYDKFSPTQIEKHYSCIYSMLHFVKNVPVLTCLVEFVCVLCLK